jgi:probable blue pigment (indigoidine) exporter
MAKRWGRPEGLAPGALGGLAFTGWQLTVGGLTLLPVAFAAEGAPPAFTGVNVMGYVYLGGFGTALAYFLWFRGIERLAAAPVTFLSLLSPVSAMAIGWAALGQGLSPVQVAGAVLALGGTVAGQLIPGRARNGKGAKGDKGSTGAPTGPLTAEPAAACGETRAA